MSIEPESNIKPTSYESSDPDPITINLSSTTKSCVEIVVVVPSTFKLPAIVTLLAPSCVTILLGTVIASTVPVSVSIFPCKVELEALSWTMLAFVSILVWSVELEALSWTMLAFVSIWS